MTLEIECKFDDCWWNSIYACNHNECYHCTRNNKSENPRKADEYINIEEKMTELYEYLMGVRLPDGVICGQPKLSAKKALDVIWFLQEVVCCLPDHIEQCKGCKQLFNSEREGIIIDKGYRHISNNRRVSQKYWGYWCDACMPGNLEIK